MGNARLSDARARASRDDPTSQDGEAPGEKGGGGVTTDGKNRFSDEDDEI